MADNKTKSDERLEHLLRRWGANEAVSETDVSGLPAPHGVRAAGWLWRWMPLAASLVLVVGAAAVFFANREPSSNMAKAPSVSPAEKTQIAELKTEAAQLRTDLAAAQKQLAAVEEGEAPETARLRANLATLKKKLEKSQAELADAAIKIYGMKKSGKNGQNVAALQDDLRKAEGALAEQRAWFKSEIARVSREKVVPGAEMEKIIRQRVDKALKELDRDWATHQKKVAELQKQLVEAKGQADGLSERLAKERELHEKEREQLAEQLDALNVKTLVLTKALSSSMRRAYLARKAPGKEGYEARQYAARKERLLKRCVELRPKLSNAEQRKAFDKIEVLLTRLDLLDVHDDAAVERFRALLKRADVAKEIEAAENAEGAGPAVDKWLLEITFVLAEK